MTSSLMGRVIRFRGGRHREVRDLLPWYPSGRLDPADHDRVQAHLKVCAECRAEVRFQQRLGAEIASLPLDVEQGWTHMLRRIREDEAPGPAPHRALRRLADAVNRAWRSSPVWGGWALAASLAAAAALWLQPFGQTGRYHALAAKPAPARGDVLVIFRPETPERDLRAALRASGARLAGGPTDADAYILSTPQAQRADALANLRRRPEVLMAEPIDPDPAP